LLSIGIDIGGTKILGALVDRDGKILTEQRVPSPAQDPDLMVDTVVKLIEGLTSQATDVIAAVGVAAAGFIDADQSHILYAPNLNWRNEPLKERLQKQVTLPVFIENDANAAGWAEYKFGAGRGSKDMAMLTLGTGVGGAIIADYKLRRGGFGIGGELGHVRVVQDGRQCGCGRRGCVEQYASGTSVVKAARKLVANEGPMGQRLREL
jgi:glucokinase